MTEPVGITLPESEILIGRLIDGEAVAQDRERFDALAANEPGLWKTLAQRQIDMQLLGACLDAELDRAGRIELPGADSDSVFAPAFNRRSWLAWSGWAAVLALGIFWWTSHLVQSNVPAGQTARGTLDGDKLTPDQHLLRYMEAPYVKGQMEPSLLEIEVRPDGSKVIHFLRRIEETVEVPAGDDSAVVNGKLVKDPAEIREASSKAPGTP